MATMNATARAAPRGRRHIGVGGGAGGAVGLVELLGSRPVVSVARLVSGHRLRVLAYHDVPDAERFRVHLEHLAARYVPVSEQEVVAAVQGRVRLPRLAVWITFDDAHPGVVERALPLLASMDVPATLFVCPGVVDTTLAYWWQVVEAALVRGLPLPGGLPQGPQAVTALKTWPDAERRRAVEWLRELLGEAAATPQVTTEQIRSWQALGLAVGNHTWDHPCLDTCDEPEQRRQTRDAHAWLVDVLDEPPTSFALPNGNAAPAAFEEVRSLGYSIVCLFDHRLSQLREGYESRLRIDADASLPRLRAICSGSHSSFLAARQRLSRS
jgi:peptidoglycan/xylan/chitin deacetylase (PgdA/CDA1 family)